MQDHKPAKNAPEEAHGATQPTGKSAAGAASDRAILDTLLNPDSSSDDTGLTFKQALAASGDLAYHWDLVANTVKWSGDTAGFGLKFEAGVPVRAIEFLRCLNTDDVILRRRALHQHVNEGEPFDIEYAFWNSEGHATWINERGSVERLKDGTPARLVGTMRVVTARKQVEERLLYEAEHDLKTGVYNRAKLSEILDDLIKHNRAFDSRGLYITVGIDRFSIVNDAFGQEAGDTVLREVVSRLTAKPQIGDVIGRVGGDTFGIAIAQSKEENISDLIQRILRDVADEPVETPSGPVRVTVSVGCASFPVEKESATEVMAKADLALRQAKNAGRNTYSRYEEARDMAKADRELLAVADRVKRALAEKRLLLAYQPIVRASSNRVAHFECLLRMIDEEGRVVSAGAFMPAIEQMGLIKEIDELVLEMAAGVLATHEDLHLALNVSGLTACDGSWMDRMRSIARNHSDVPPRMQLEITETALLKDVEETAAFVREIREMGATVALDDFGAGYTSFKNLKSLPINVVKIDGSFIREVALEKENQKFVKAMVSLAHGLGMETVAECVETDHDASVLTAYGVDLLQGYFYGKPDTAPDWLKKKDKDED